MRNLFEIFKIKKLSISLEILFKSTDTDKISSISEEVEKITSNKETSPKELPTYTKGVDNYKLADKNTLEGLSRTNGSPGCYNRRLESHAGETQNLTICSKKLLVIQRLFIVSNYTVLINILFCLK